MSLLRTLLLSLMLSAVLAFPVLAEPLDLNTASAPELAAALSGVGPKKAEAIVTYREQNGEFQSVDEITQVSGIGPKLLEANRANLMVGASAPEASETAVADSQ